jgi:hypothetical protein
MSATVKAHAKADTVLTAVEVEPYHARHADTMAISLDDIYTAR